MKNFIVGFFSFILFSTASFSSFAIGPFNSLSLRTPGTNATISLIEVDFALSLARAQI